MNLDLLLNSTVEDIANGFSCANNMYVCLLCGEKYKQGLIYKHDYLLMDAELYMKQHIAQAHGSVFEFLLGLDKKYTGLTEQQRRLMHSFYSGKSDKQIVEDAGSGSTSTVRNHRFILKEKERQAKVFLALSILMKTEPDLNNRINNPADTELHKYFDTSGGGLKLKFMPARHMKKRFVVEVISKQFEHDREYTEKQVNAIIKAISDEYADIRRYLINFGFLDRTDDGKTYWVKKGD